MNRDEPVFPVHGHCNLGITKGELEIIMYRAAAMAFFMGENTAWDYASGKCNATLGERSCHLADRLQDFAVESDAAKMRLKDAPR